MLDVPKIYMPTKYERKSQWNANECPERAAC